ncbi:MAG: signal peptidase I [Oscillospiraceae bacterium]|nr:signal peptidase I [Oscillospiraceae bacterium]
MLKNKKVISFISLSSIIFTIISFVFITGYIYFNISFNVVITGSMEPDMPVGSAIFVKKNIATNLLEDGDIILFNYKNNNIIHRIVDIYTKDDSLYFKTKGDNNEFIDDFDTNQKDIIGKHLITIPIIGYILSSIRNNSIFLFLFFGFVFIYCIFSIRSILKDIDEYSTLSATYDALYG